MNPRQVEQRLNRLAWQVYEQCSEETEIVVAAFQRHFRRRLVDGVADKSTIRTLERLLASAKATAAK